MINPRVKTVSSTSSVDFRNTSGAYYDMIISVQNQTIDQSINITDTEGNLITEQPIALTVPAKVILKDVKIGTISFSDSNSYNIIISYIVKEVSTEIPYINIDYQNGYIYSQETGEPKLISTTFTADTYYTVSPPAGKKWILRSIIMSWTAAATQTDYPQIQIYPTEVSSNSQTIAEGSLNILYTSLSVTEGDVYVISAAKYIQSMSNVSLHGIEATQQPVQGGFELYPNETLSLFVELETATATAYISYIEVNLG